MSRLGKWPMVAVEQFAEVVTGGTPSTSVREYWESGTVPWLNSGELNKGVITYADNFITEAGLKNSAARLMPEDTVLIALTGATTGISALLKTRACGNQSVTGVLPSQKHDSRFLLQYLRTIRPRIVSDSWGGAQKHISQAYIKGLKVPLPPLAEQRRIAEVLDRAEALRTKRRAALAQLHSLIQSFFRDFFGELATCAKNFPTARLGAVTTFIDYRGISPNKQPSGVRLVTARNIKRGWFEGEPQEFIPADEYVTWMRRGMPRTGDVLFTTEGHTLGSAAQLPHFEKAALAQRLIALQPSEQLCSEYLLQVILGRAFQHEVFRRATGSAARGISSKQLAEIVVAVPPIDLQREFARRVRAVEKLKKAHRASLVELDALFATLQHRAFSGELFSEKDAKALGSSSVALDA